MMPIKRHILHSEITNYLKNPQKIFAVEGVRQTGKTTAIEQAIAGKAHTLVTLSDEDLATSQVRDAKTFDELTLQLKRHFQFEPNTGSILIFDEAQRSPTLYSFLMQMEKAWQHTPIILSGSVMGAFFKRHDNDKRLTPAGRITKTICRPFSFYEFLEWTEQKPLLEELQQFDIAKPLPNIVHEQALRSYFDYMTTGGFPEAIRARKDTNKVYTYLQTLLSFFAQDADRYLTEVTGSPRYQYGQLLQTTFQALARHTGDPTKRSSLISTDSPAYRTILPALLDAIEAWHFMFRLPTTTKTLSNRQGFSSKKYLWDVGIANYLLNLNRPISAASEPTLLAKLLEGSVAQELIFYLKTADRLMSWKSQHKQSRELDFLARFPQADVGIEVKSGTRIHQKAISQLIEFIKVNPKGHFYVVYLGPYHPVKWNDSTIHWVPPYLIGQMAQQNFL